MKVRIPERILHVCVRWFCFTVFLGILPYLVHSVIQVAGGTTWGEHLAKGSLALIVMVLSAAGVGHVVVPPSTKHVLAKAFAVTGCLGALVASGAVLWTAPTCKPEQYGTIALISVLIYVIGLASSSTAVILSEM